MVLRRAKTSAHAGKEFWGCSMYPKTKCGGIRQKNLIWRSFVYSSMKPSTHRRKKIGAALPGLLQWDGEGAGCCLGAGDRELELKVTIVGTADRDHFQREFGERFYTR
jgi:hypothetical protein